MVLKLILKLSDKSNQQLNKLNKRNKAAYCQGSTPPACALQGLSWWSLQFCHHRGIQRFHGRPHRLTILFRWYKRRIRRQSTTTYQHKLRLFQRFFSFFNANKGNICKIHQNSWACALIFVIDSSAGVVLQGIPFVGVFDLQAQIGKPLKKFLLEAPSQPKRWSPGMVHGTPAT